MTTTCYGRDQTHVEPESPDPRPESPCLGPTREVTLSAHGGNERSRRKLLQPSPEQLEGARSWLVRVVARRAVDILRAEERDS